MRTAKEQALRDIYISNGSSLEQEIKLQVQKAEVLKEILDIIQKPELLIGKCFKINDRFDKEIYIKVIGVINKANDKELHIVSSNHHRISSYYISNIHHFIYYFETEISNEEFEYAKQEYIAKTKKELESLERL